MAAKQQQLAWLRRFTKTQGWANGKLHSDAFKCRAPRADRPAESGVSYTELAPPVDTREGQEAYLAHFEAFAKRPLGLCCVDTDAFGSTRVGLPIRDTISDVPYGDLHWLTPCPDDEDASKILQRAILIKGI